MAAKFNLPGTTVIGDNALQESGDILKTFGKKAFIVTGKVVTKVGITKVLTDYLTSLGIEYEIFNDITGEPTDAMIEEGVKAFKKANCDFCIGIGGGSPLDSAKAIAAMTVLEGSISDYMGKELEGDFPKLVLIPTTAGTGSEATKFTVITDTKKDIKMLLKGDVLLPNLAIIDWNFTKSSPKSVTAATGMDALTHAVESYTSRKANPLTDMYAISAIKRIFKYLPIAYKDGVNEEARKEIFHVAHGISNAMLIKECLSYVLDGAYKKFADLGRLVNPKYEGESDKEAAEDAMASGSPSNTIKAVTKEDLIKIYNKLW